MPTDPPVPQRFIDHMRDDVFWLGDPAYMDAFRDLTGETTVTEAAFTQTDKPLYPGFVNAQLSADGKAMVLSARGEPVQQEHGTMCGHVAQLSIPLDDWDQFIAHAQQVRARAPEDEPHPALPGLDD